MELRLLQVVVSSCLTAEFTSSTEREMIFILVLFCFFTFTCWLSSVYVSVFRTWFICHSGFPLTCMPVNIKYACIYPKKTSHCGPVYFDRQFSLTLFATAAVRKHAGGKDLSRKVFALLRWGFLTLFSRTVQFSRNVSYTTAPTGSRWYGSSELFHTHQA